VRIKKGDVKAFEEVFNSYYAPLVRFGIGILNDRDLSEEQVQQVFANLWTNRGKLKDGLPLFPYLLTAVKNACLNVIAHNRVKLRYHQSVDVVEGIEDQYDFEDVPEDILSRLENAIRELPPKCREVLELSRFQGFSHKQIEEKLDISVKTVENHITRALRILREKLS